MEKKTVSLSEIYLDPNNARKHDQKNLDAIKGSLKKYGQVEPLVVQKSKKIIIGGNGRYTAMREMGFETVEIVEVDLDDTQAMSLALALNRTSELASWDDEILGKQLQALYEDGFEIGDIGFDLGNFNLDEPTELKDITGSKELSADDFSEFDHKCPKCGFEFDTNKT